MITLAGYAAVNIIGILSLSLLNPRALTLLQAFFKAGTTHSLESREGLWSRSIELFLENPVLGVGAGQPIFSHVSHSHNVIIDFSRTLGVPGLLLILVVLTTIVVLCLQTILSALRASRSDLSVRCLCIGTSLGPLAYVAANFPAIHSARRPAHSSMPLSFSTLHAARFYPQHPGAVRVVCSPEPTDFRFNRLRMIRGQPQPDPG